MDESTEQKIVDYIKANPFSSRTRIARYFELAPSTVTFHINNIRKKDKSLIFNLKYHMKDGKRRAGKPIKQWRFIK